MGNDASNPDQCQKSQLNSLTCCDNYGVLLISVQILFSVNFHPILIAFGSDSNMGIRMLHLDQS